MSIENFSIPPYFDDYNELKKYLKVLFKPRRSVQTRELNQVQSILQNQIGRHADHIFKEGAMVVPGHISYDLEYSFVKVVSNTNLDQEAYRNENFQDKIIQNSVGVSAKIVNHIAPNIDGHVTFFVKYISSDTVDGTLQTFSANQILTVIDTALTVTVAPAPSTPIGKGSAVNIDSGIYYAKKAFHLVDPQTIILEPYSQTPSYRVGLRYTDEIITSDFDNSIVDNAQGFPNFTAPGADRYKVELVLTKIPLALENLSEEIGKNFYELLKIDTGKIETHVQRTELSELEKTFARRTFDESGDYTVRPFHIRVSPNGNPEKLNIEVDPGKAYVRGYEIEKVGKTILELDKARDFERANNTTVSTPIGNYVRVNGISGIPNIRSYPQVTLYDRRIQTPQSAPSGNIIGTARVRDFQLESGVFGTDTAVYRAYLFDIKITNTSRTFSHVKSLVDLANKFTCDSVIEPYFPIEFGRDQKVTMTNSSATVTGKNTLWQNDPNPELRLAVNDTIVVNNVLYTVATVASNTSITVSPTPSITTGDYSIAYTYTKLYESRLNNLLFPLPYSYPRKLKSADDITVDTNYITRRLFTGLVVSGGAVTISTGDADEVFTPFSSNDYIVTYDTGIDAGINIGDIANVNAGNFSALPNNSVTISGLVNGETVRVIASILKTEGTVSTQKMKSVVATEVQSIADETGLQEISLGKADIYRITGIYVNPGNYSSAMSSASIGSYTDITDRYELDNGQRDNFYGIGKIILKPNSRIPSGRVLVTFEYFQHAGNGTYFSVDSYVGAVDYEDIPKFESKQSGWTYELRDCLDFRPRINDAGSAFDNTTGSLTEFPVKGFVSLDMSYYLNRVDKLYLDYKGNFHIRKGVSGLNPKPPEDPSDDGMVTHQLNIRAYTKNPDAVIIDYKDNKRYTMRDIGRLDKRLQNVEYYTKLSLLEKDTKDLEIIDPQTGLDRFKNGFIVDPFTGHGIGDVQNPDYKCSIDMKEGKLRPIFVEDNVRIVFDETSSSNFTKRGDLITLPFTEEVLISQVLASNSINVNPFNVINFVGKVSLTPPNDEWKDTNVLPDLIVNQDGNFDSIRSMANGMGTIWNEWETNWAGISSSNTEVVSIQTIVATEPQLHRNLDGSIDSQSGLAGVRSRPGIDEWPVRQLVTTRTTETFEERQSRTGRVANVVPNTITTNLGQKVVDVSYIPFIRTRDVVFTGIGLKPNTRVYPFFDKVNVASNVSPGSNFVTPSGALVTDNTGKVTGTFRIPANTFRTGSRVFRLSSSNVDDEGASTRANATYHAEGLLETKQSTILSTRNAEIVWGEVRDDRILTDTTIDMNVTDTDWIDPLAQTIMVTKDGGAFISEIELYVRKKSSNIPITVQIRETVNGYPGQRILPFGDITVDASEVHTNEVINGELIIDGGSPIAEFTSENFVSTKFVPESLIYLKQGVEYCLVILANTDDYEVWISTFGTNPETEIPYTLIGTELPVQAQAYGGVFFKSANASTWTAVQESDLMFKMKYAKFNTAITGDLRFNNEAIPAKVLESNPFQVVEGYKKIRIMHKNHGMNEISSVNISGVPNVSGILASRINGNHEIENVEYDSYIIDLAEVTLNNVSSTGTALSGTNFTANLIPGTGIRNASGVVRRIVSVTNNTAAVIDVAFSPDLSDESVTIVAGNTLNGGGNSIVASQDKQVDVIYPIVSRMEFPSTFSEFFIKTTSGKSIDGNQTPYIFDANYRPVIVNENIEFSSPRLIASPLNETNEMLGEKSFELRTLMQTSNENLSPVIDTARLSLITVANRIDSPSLTRNVEFIDIDTLAVSTAISFAASDNSINSSNGTIARQLSSIQKGRFIEITGASNSGNNQTFLVKSVVYVNNTSIKIIVDKPVTTETVGSSITVKYLFNFISEESPLHGSSASKYVSRRMLLKVPANALHMTLSANIPEGASIEMYYKLSKTDSSENFDEISYVKVEPEMIPVVSSDPNELQEIVYSANDLPDFNMCAFKIVLKSTNTTKVPSLKDFRAIALGT